MGKVPPSLVITKTEKPEQKSETKDADASGGVGEKVQRTRNESAPEGASMSTQFSTDDGRRSIKQGIVAERGAFFGGSVVGNASTRATASSTSPVTGETGSSQFQSTDASSRRDMGAQTEDTAGVGEGVTSSILDEPIPEAENSRLQSPLTPTRALYTKTESGRIENKSSPKSISASTRFPMKDDRRLIKPGVVAERRATFGAPVARNASAQTESSQTSPAAGGTENSQLQSTPTFSGKDRGAQAEDTVMTESHVGGEVTSFTLDESIPEAENASLQSPLTPTSVPYTKTAAIDKGEATSFTHGETVDEALLDHALQANEPIVDNALLDRIIAEGEGDIAKADRAIVAAKKDQNK